MNRHVYFLSICCMLMAVRQASPIQETTEYRGQYLVQNLPGYKPEPYAPDIFSAWNDYGLHPQSSVSLSPGGGELYFVDQSYPVVKGRSRSIWSMRRIGDVWEEPQVTPFSSDYADWGVFLSEDGSIVNFCSTRPLRGKGVPKDADLWRVSKKDSSLSEPERIDHPVNTAFDEVCGAAAEDGVLLFSSNRPIGEGGFDIYSTRSAGGNYAEPINLGKVVNTKADERVMCVAPDLSFLILHRYDATREASAGLYVAYKLSDQSWSEPKSIGDHINMFNATWASLSPDGEYLFFLGTGYGVYWLKTELINYLKKADLDISEALLRTLNDNGLESACAEYFVVRNEHKKYVDVDEFFLNQKGYQLLQAGDITRAIGIFRICVALFPTSWNAHDSLAEALLAAGDIEQAKTHYLRSLELNPGNGNARQRIEELEMK